MPTGQVTLIQFANHYIEFCNAPGSTAQGLKEFYDEAVEWQEMPHRFAPTGQIRNFASLQVAFTKGRELTAQQSYVLDDVVVSDNAAALQISWGMTFAQALGDMAAGAKLSGKLAIFFRLKDGKIIRQTDYLCYDPIA